MVGPTSAIGDPVPYLMCSSSALQQFGWGSQAWEYNPNYNPAASPGSDESEEFIGIEINDDIITIADVFGQESDNDPYFLAEKGYYIPLPTSFNGDPCNRAIAMVLEGRYEHSKVISGKTIKYEAIEPGALFCNRLFSRTPMYLSDVTWSSPAVSRPPQIVTVQPEPSTTFFHELTHLATWWLGTSSGMTGSGADERQIKVIDITCS